MDIMVILSFSIATGFVGIAALSNEKMQELEKRVKELEKNLVEISKRKNSPQHMCRGE